MLCCAASVIFEAQSRIELQRFERLEMAALINQK